MVWVTYFAHFLPSILVTGERTWTPRVWYRIYTSALFITRTLHECKKKTYLDSFKFESMCHTEFGPATVYVLRDIAIVVLIATPPGSTLNILSRTLQRCTWCPREKSRALTALGPNRWLWLMQSLTRSSSAASLNCAKCRLGCKPNSLQQEQTVTIQLDQSFCFMCAISGKV